MFLTVIIIISYSSIIINYTAAAHVNIRFRFPLVFSSEMPFSSVFFCEALTFSALVRLMRGILLLLCYCGICLK